MSAIALCILVIGIKGTLVEAGALNMLASMIVGGVIGTWLDLDGHLALLGDALGRLVPSGGKGASVAQGFVSASLICCVGSMGILGAVQAGVTGDCTLLFTKTFLDAVSVLFLSVSLGIGAVFSCLSVFALQGSFVAIARMIEPFLTDAVMQEISGVGSILLVALGLNMLGLTKLKLSNLLPAIFVAPLISSLLRFCGVG